MVKKNKEVFEYVCYGILLGTLGFFVLFTISRCADTFLSQDTQQGIAQRPIE